MYIPCYLNQVNPPHSNECVRKHGHLWWERFHDGPRRCEVLDDNEKNEECGVCGRPGYFYNDSLSKRYRDPGCWHFALGWLYDVVLRKDSSYYQACHKMDHCRISYLANKSMIAKVCGGEERGICRSVYGSYTCNCKRSFQGRDCEYRDLDGKGKV